MIYAVESFAAHSRPIVKALRDDVTEAEALYVELVTCGFARVTLRMHGLLIHQSGAPAGVYRVPNDCPVCSGTHRGRCPEAASYGEDYGEARGLAS